MNPYQLSNRRYTGSKAQLLEWIAELVLEHTAGNSFLDLFAGTGVVAEEASRHFSQIIVNDFLPSNYASYQGFFGKGRYSAKKIDKKIFEYNLIDATLLGDNYFSTSYGDKFFSMENARKIGRIRDLIEAEKEEFTKREYWILLCSLMYSADKVANTVGHYDAFFSKQSNRGVFMMKPIAAHVNSGYKIYHKDANLLAKTVQADVVYIDPPYNSRQYSRFYHVLDNLITWEKPELFGVARKPEPTNMSEYSKTGAKHAFKDLIENLNCKYIVVSYNNTFNPKSSSSKNKITFDELLEILNAKGDTITESKSHKHFNAGSTKFDDHREYLFITKVR